MGVEWVYKLEMKYGASIAAGHLCIEFFSIQLREYYCIFFILWNVSLDKILPWVSAVTADAIACFRTIYKKDSPQTLVQIWLYTYNMETQKQLFSLCFPCLLTYISENESNFYKNSIFKSLIMTIETMYIIFIFKNCYWFWKCLHTRWKKCYLFFVVGIRWMGAFVSLAAGITSWSYL